MERLRRVRQLPRVPSLSRWSHCWLTGNQIKNKYPWFRWFTFTVKVYLWNSAFIEVLSFYSFLSTARTSTLHLLTRPSACSTWRPASASKGWRVTRVTSTRAIRQDVDPRSSWVVRMTAPSRSGIRDIVASSTVWTAHTKLQLYHSMTPPSRL